MEEFLSRTWEQLVGRETGAMHLRILFQPLMATFIAIHSGLRDAREGRPLFFWTLVRDAAQRRALFAQLWKDLGKVFIAAATLDVIYQLWILKWFYPVQALIVALVLAVLPYLIVRGVTKRIASGVGAKP